MGVVYFIESKLKRWIYVGSTENIKQRFAEHNAGKVKSTKSYRPFRLIYLEIYSNYNLARTRENELKSNNYQKEVILKRIKDKNSTALQRRGGRVV